MKVLRCPWRPGFSLCILSVYNILYMIWYKIISYIILYAFCLHTFIEVSTLSTPRPTSLHFGVHLERCHAGSGKTAILPFSMSFSQSYDFQYRLKISKLWIEEWTQSITCSSRTNIFKGLERWISGLEWALVDLRGLRFNPQCPNGGS